MDQRPTRQLALSFDDTDVPARPFAGQLDNAALELPADPNWTDGPIAPATPDAHPVWADDTEPDTDPELAPIHATPRPAAVGGYAVAPLRARAFAGAIDGALTLGIVTVNAVLAAWSFGFARLQPAASHGVDFIADSLLPNRWFVFGALLATTALLFAYQWLCVAFAGRTAGQRLYELRTVDRAGKPLTPLASATRALALSVSIGTLGLGLVLMLIDRRRQALHDLIAGSFVVTD